VSDTREAANADPDDGRSGPGFVLVLYVLLVAFGGVAGVLFATVVESPRPPVLFFLVTLSPTRLGFALYGASTMVVVLGLPLAAVVYVSRTRID
jgi:hypothetical protein